MSDFGFGSSDLGSIRTGFRPGRDLRGLLRGQKSLNWGLRGFILILKLALGSERPNLGSERSNLGSQRLTLRSERPNLGSERSNLGS